MITPQQCVTQGHAAAPARTGWRDKHPSGSLPRVCWVAAFLLGLALNAGPVRAEGAASVKVLALPFQVFAQTDKGRPFAADCPNPWPTS